MSVVSIEVRGVALLRGDGLAPEWDLGACFRYALRQGTRVKAPIIIIDVMTYPVLFSGDALYNSLPSFSVEKA